MKWVLRLGVDARLGTCVNTIGDSLCPIFRYNSNMNVHHHTIRLSTSGKGTYSITDQVREAFGQSKVKQGVATVFVQHLGSLSSWKMPARRADGFARVFDRLVPENEPYFIHTYGNPDDMPSHIRTVLTKFPRRYPLSTVSWHWGLGKDYFCLNTARLRIHKIIVTTWDITVFPVSRSSARYQLTPIV